ncbi:Transporter of the ATP-binding cassette (ABC), partial [Coemansia sp. RSA 2559]
MIQRHTIFLRPITSPTNESTDRYFDASIDNSTPFAYKNDLNESYLVDTPESGASLFDRMMVSWPTEIFRRGAASGLNNKDIYRLKSNYSPIPNWKCYLRHRKSNRSMFVALVLTFISEATLKFTYTIIISMLEYASPFFLQHILRYIENSDNAESTDTLRNAYLYAFGMLFFTNLDSILSRQDTWISTSVSMKIYSILGGELSVKTLRRRGKGSWDKPKTDEKDPSAKGSQSSSDEGRIVNLMGSDALRVSYMLNYIEDVFELPISLGFGLFYIYKLLGISALIGLAVVVLYIPLSKLIFNQVIKARKAQRLMSDKRIAMITEAIQGIRAVKLFGWESRFMKNIAEQHNKQLKYTWIIFAWRVVISVSSEMMPVFVLVLILYMYTIVFGNKLTAEIAFTSLSVFRTVYYAIFRVQNYFTNFTDIFVSIDRINTYLGSSHIQDLEERVTSNSENVLGFEGADLEWMSPEEKTNDDATEVAVASSIGTVKSPATEQTPLLLGETPSTQVPATANGSS